MRKFLLAAIVAIFTIPAASAQEQNLRMATIAPSLGQAITMATFANLVTENLDGVSIEVSAGGAATLHMMEVGRGNLEMSMTSPVVYNLMSAGKAMYAKEPDAPELSKNYQLLMWFPYGQYHFTVRSDSDIQKLDDLEGTTVFLGPQGGGAYNGAKGWIEVTTGLVADEDYEAIKANWQTGFQAFLDGKIDMYVNGCIDPCSQLIQFTETENLRFLEPEDDTGENVDKWLGAFRYRDKIPSGMYEGQTNDGPINSWNTAVGIGVRADLDEETVYNITRTFWENIDSITSEAPWAKAIDISYAGVKRGKIELHPGAERYYKEVNAIE